MLNGHFLLAHSTAFVATPLSLRFRSIDSQPNISLFAINIAANQSAIRTLDIDGSSEAQYLKIVQFVATLKGFCVPPHAEGTTASSNPTPESHLVLEPCIANRRDAAGSPTPENFLNIFRCSVPNNRNLIQAPLLDSLDAASIPRLNHYDAPIPFVVACSPDNTTKKYVGCHLLVELPNAPVFLNLGRADSLAF